MSTQTRTRRALLAAAAFNGWEVRDYVSGNLTFVRGDTGIHVAFKAGGTRISYAEASQETEDSWAAPRIFTEQGRPSHIASENVRAQVLAVLSA